MDPSTLFGAHPEAFGPLMILAFGAAYVTAVVVGYRRGWPPAAWLVVLAAAGLGGIVGMRLLPLGMDGLRALWEGGALPEAGTRRIPGTVVGALLAAEAARRLLGVRVSMLDPLATAGLVALAVVRVGCLLAGCCFGTVTSLPWGVTYASGSFVHGFHLAHGVVEAGAAGPAAVHPIPFYDLLFALGMLALLPRLGRSLKASGSLCGVTVGAYAVFRFAQDFVRANEVEAVAGLTAVQVGMVGLAMVAVGAVWLAERSARGLTSLPDLWVEPAAARLVAVLVGVLALRVALDGWLTTSEAAVMLIRLVPAIAAVAVVVAQRTSVPQLRWSAAALGAAIPLVVGFQTLPEPAEPFDLFAVEVHGDLGQYQEYEICSPDLYTYTSGGVGVARIQVDPEREMTREMGLRVYGGSQSVVGRDGAEPDPESRRLPFGAIVPYYRLEGKNAGFTVGAQVGELPLLGEDSTTPVLPVLGVRLGPRDVGYIEGGFLDGPHVGVPGGVIHLGVGAGRLTAAGQEVGVGVGVSGSGVYLKGSAPLSPTAVVEGIGAYAPTSDGQGPVYQVGARLRVHLSGQ